MPISSRRYPMRSPNRPQMTELTAATTPATVKMRPVTVAGDSAGSIDCTNSGSIGWTTLTPNCADKQNHHHHQQLAVATPHADVAQQAAQTGPTCLGRRGHEVLGHKEHSHHARQQEQPAADGEAEAVAGLAESSPHSSLRANWPVWRERRYM